MVPQTVRNQGPLISYLDKALISLYQTTGLFIVQTVGHFGRNIYFVKIRIAEAEIVPEAKTVANPAKTPSPRLVTFPFSSMQATLPITIMIIPQTICENYEQVLIKIRGRGGTEGLVDPSGEGGGSKFWGEDRRRNAKTNVTWPGGLYFYKFCNHLKTPK